MPGDAVGRAVLRALARAARRLDRGLPGAKALLRPFDGPGAPLSTAEGARKGPLWRAVRRALGGSERYVPALPRPRSLQAEVSATYRQHHPYYRNFDADDGFEALRALNRALAHAEELGLERAPRAPEGRGGDPPVRPAAALEEGLVLLAHPTLTGIFARSVILLCRHNQDGSYGLIINKLLPQRVADLALGAADDDEEEDEEDEVDEEAEVLGLAELAALAEQGQAEAPAGGAVAWAPAASYGAEAAEAEEQGFEGLECLEGLEGLRRQRLSQGGPVPYLQIVHDVPEKGGTRITLAGDPGEGPGEDLFLGGEWDHPLGPSGPENLPDEGAREEAEAAGGASTSDRGEGAEAGRRPRVRYFLGESGWYEGQLQDEVDRGYWILARAKAQHLNLLGDGVQPDERRLRSLWADSLAAMGGEYAAFASIPELDEEEE